MDRPVFLLSAGGRTGSTLLQRLIISTREVLVWGEHEGCYMAAVEQLLARLHDLHGGRSQDQYAALVEQGAQAWVANVNPPFSHALEGARALFLASLGRPALELGFPRWGFKEIRYGGTSALGLRTLFPAARFVIGVRNPAAALRSIKATGWYGKDHQYDPGRFLGKWADLAGGLLDALPQLGPALLVRHEDLLDPQEASLASLGAHLGIDPGRFDRTVFGKVLRGISGPPAELDLADRAALGQPAVLAVAERLGYAPAQLLG